MKKIQAGEVATADVLNRPLETHISDPEAHQGLRATLEEHNRDKNAHNIPTRIKAIVQAHENDSSAHIDYFTERITEMLSDHTHPELVEQVRTEISNLIMEHLNSNFHPGYETFIHSVPVGFQVAREGELFFNPTDRKLYIKLNGEAILVSNV